MKGISLDAVMVIKKLNSKMLAVDLNLSLIVMKTVDAVDVRNRLQTSKLSAISGILLSFSAIW